MSRLPFSRACTITCIMVVVLSPLEEAFRHSIAKQHGILQAFCASRATTTTAKPVTESTAGVCSTSSGAWLHSRISNYSASELLAARCDEPLLILLQRSLLRIARLKEISSAEKFTELFPEGFTSQSRNQKLVHSAVELSANAVGFGLGHALGLADTIVFNGVAPVYDYGEWLIELQAEAASLAKSGAEAASGVWNDVLLGLIYDVFSKVKQAWNLALDNQAVITMPTQLYSEGSNDVLDLPVGTFVQLLETDDTTAEDIQVAVQEEIGSSGRMRQGRVAKADIAPHAWLMWHGDDPIHICAKKEEACPTEYRVGSISPGQTIKVVHGALDGSDSAYWKLAGEVGWVPRFDKFDGPLPREDALRNQIDLENELSTENMTLVEGKMLSQFNSAWTSKPAQHSKLAVGVGLFIGGILTHGLLWIVASAVGVMQAATDIGVVVKMTQLLLGHVGYVALALAQFERALFSGTTQHETCTPDELIHAACPSGFACVTHGVFFQREALSEGFCARAPHSPMPAGETCAVDTDCSSGHCQMIQEFTETADSEQLARLLQGSCKPR